MQSILPWSKTSQPRADSKQTLTRLATFCAQQKTKEDELQQRIEQITVAIKAKVKSSPQIKDKKKLCMPLLLEKRRCEHNLHSISEQRLRALSAYDAIQRIGNENEFVEMMTDANRCMQEMGLPAMRVKAERASDTANDLANDNKELEDALQHFGASFNVDETDFDEELNEILSMPGDGVSPGLLADAPGTAISSSSFPRVPAAVVASPKAKQPAREPRPSVVSV